MKHDYAAAMHGLEIHNSWRRGADAIEMCNPKELGEWIETAIHALAMMQKLQEPSGMMLGVGSIVINSIGINELYTSVAGRTLKAMLEQAEKEIEG